MSSGSPLIQLFITITELDARDKDSGTRESLCYDDFGQNASLTTKMPQGSPVVRTKKSPTRKLTQFSAMAVLVMLALLLLPIAVRAEAPAKLSANERSEEEIDGLVEQMLSAGDYVEGEAIVCYLPADSNEITVQASDLLANAEHLSEVTS